MQFNELHLNSSLLEVLTAKGYNAPTPIQQQAIPPVMAGNDVLGLAQTGTGKTAAFALPILHRLLANPLSAESPQNSNRENWQRGREPQGGRGRDHRRGPRGGNNLSGRNRPIRALVLAPTRELATQINDSFRAYGKKTPLRVATVIGGVSQGKQIHELRSGIDVLVACPGRLLDLMQQGFVKLDRVEYVVLDEADRMLDMGFIPDIRKILARVPEKRQTLLFSATMPKEVESLVADFMTDPVRIEIAPVSTLAAKVDHALYYVDKGNKPALLKHLLLDQREGVLANGEGNRVLVFARTRRSADRVTERLEKCGIRTECIHGSKTQGAREKALREFKRGVSRVMVATDIAARGLDVTNITHVVNYDLPNEPETFVHRIGRTGRAGASGIAISFCDNSEAGFLGTIERLIRTQLPKVLEQPYHCDSAQGAHLKLINRPAAPAGGRGGAQKFGRKPGNGGNRFGRNSRGPKSGGNGERRSEGFARKGNAPRSGQARKSGGAPQPESGTRTWRKPRPNGVPAGVGAELD